MCLRRYCIIKTGIQMKITKEELSKLDVKAYVEFIEQRYEQLEQAVEMLSGLELKMQQQGQQEKSRSENLSCNRQDLREPPRGKVIPQQKQQKKKKAGVLGARYIARSRGNE